MKCIAGCGRETGSEHPICDLCAIGQLEHDAEVAIKRLIEGYRKLLKLEKEKEND